VMSTRMRYQRHDDPLAPEDLQMINALQEQVAHRPTPFEPGPLDIRYRFLGPRFHVLRQVTFNGATLHGNAELKLADSNPSILTDTGRIPYLLEGVFSCCATWAKINIQQNQVHLPKHMGACTLFPERCAQATSANIQIHLTDAKDSLHFNCVVLDEQERPLIVMRDCVSAPSGIPHPLKRSILAKAAPLRYGNAHLLLLDRTKAIEYGRTHQQEILTSSEIEEIATQGSDKRRDEKLAGKLAAKLLAETSYKTHDENNSIALNRYQVLSNNGPVQFTLDAKSLTEYPHFSISHTEGLVCAARAEKRVGVDVEYIRTIADKTVTDLCGDTLQQQMQDYIAGQAADTKEQAFLSLALPILLFTQKEAVLKAAGIGIGEGLSGSIWPTWR